MIFSSVNMPASCNTISNYSETIQNKDFFLKPGTIIALNQINLRKKTGINLSGVVNIYCDAVARNIFNTQGVLRSIPIPISDEKIGYFSNFQDDLIFLELGYLNNEIKVTTDPDFVINYFQLVVIPKK